MDEMKDSDIGLLLEYIPYAAKNDLEMMRNIMWATMSPYMKKKMSARELFPLTTDDDYAQHNDNQIVTNEQIEKWQKKAALLQDYFDTKKKKELNEQR